MNRNDNDANIAGTSPYMKNGHNRVSSMHDDNDNHTHYVNHTRRSDAAPISLSLSRRRGGDATATATASPQLRDDGYGESTRSPSLSLNGRREDHATATATANSHLGSNDKDTSPSIYTHDGVHTHAHEAVNSSSSSSSAVGGVVTSLYSSRKTPNVDKCVHVTLDTVSDDQFENDSNLSTKHTRPFDNDSNLNSNLNSNCARQFQDYSNLNSHGARHFEDSGCVWIQRCDS
jgi:hypothetical protein